MYKGRFTKQTYIKNSKCLRTNFTRLNSQKPRSSLHTGEIGPYFLHSYITAQDNSAGASNAPKENEKTLYFCKRSLRAKNDSTISSHKECVQLNSKDILLRQAASVERDVDDNTETQSNLVIELQRSLSMKEAEILSLRHERVKMKMELEDCRKELRIQTKKLESLKSLFGESQLNVPFLNEVNLVKKIS